MFRMPLEAFTQDEDFPFFIQYGEHDEPLFLHAHDSYVELVIVLSGSAVHIVDGEKYLPVNEEGNSVFEIPVKVLNEPFDIIGDTTAMSEPHEIDYKLTCIVEQN